MTICDRLRTRIKQSEHWRSDRGMTRIEDAPDAPATYDERYEMALKFVEWSNTQLFAKTEFEKMLICMILDGWLIFDFETGRYRKTKQGLDAEMLHTPEGSA